MYNRHSLIYLLSINNKHVYMYSGVPFFDFFLDHCAHYTSSSLICSKTTERISSKSVNVWPPPPPPPPAYRHLCGARPEGSRDIDFRLQISDIFYNFGSFINHCHIILLFSDTELVYDSLRPPKINIQPNPSTFRPPGNHPTGHRDINFA